jgi:hypothetical protein
MAAFGRGFSQRIFDLRRAQIDVDLLSSLPRHMAPLMLNNDSDNAECFGMMQACPTPLSC